MDSMNNIKKLNDPKNSRNVIDSYISDDLPSEGIKPKVKQMVKMKNEKDNYLYSPDLNIDKLVAGIENEYQSLANAQYSSQEH